MCRLPLSPAAASFVRLARCRQLHGTAAAVEELAAEGGFQSLDMLGNGSLGDEKLLGCFGKAPALGRGNEQPQLGLVHVLSPYTII